MSINSAAKTGSPVAWNQKAGILALLLLAVSAALCLRQFNLFYVGQINDDARHVLAAQALLEGQYTSTFRPDPLPINNLLPGYPLVIAPALKLGGVTAVRLLSLAATLAGIFFLFRLAPSLGLALAIYALHPLTARYSGVALTEPLYTMWTIAALWLLDRAGWRLSPLLLLFAAFASWIRPEGFLFLLALAPFCARGRDRRSNLIYAAGALAIFAAPYLRNMLVSGTPARYFSELASGRTLAETFSSLLSAIAANIRFYAAHLPGAVFPNPFRVPPAWLAIPVGLFFWAGLLRGIRLALVSGDRTKGAMAVYLVLMLGLHLFWVNFDPRYDYPLIPFVLVLFFGGLEDFPRLRRAALAAALCLIAANAVYIFKPPAAGPRSDPSRAFEWIKANTAPDERIAATYIESSALNTGRKGYSFSQELHPDYWYLWFLSNDIRYAIYERGRFIRMVPARAALIGGEHEETGKLLTDRARFKAMLLDEAGGAAVFKVTPPEGFRRAAEEMRKAEFLSASGGHDQALLILRGLERAKAPLKRLDFTLGTALLMKGDFSAARPYLLRAAAAEPGFAAAARNLVLVNRSLAPAK